MDAELLERGVVTIPILTEEETQKYRNIFADTVETFPEYLYSGGTKIRNNKKRYYILDGFGALGNPASFHNPLVRILRLKCYQKAKGLLLKLGDGRYICVEFDRMRIFAAGKQIGKESWHRDECAAPGYDEKNDIMLGGWLNLGPFNQYFSCVPGTHKNPPKKGAFAKISGEEAERYNQIKEKIEIKPGHMIVFYQHIVHEVFGGKKKMDELDEYRLFTGWRLTHSEKPLQDIDAIIRDQAVPRLPSYQKPWLWLGNHWRFEKNRKRLEEWSKETFIPEVLEDVEMKSGPQKGQKFTVVQRYMKSLRELGLPLYPEYSELERHILFPHK